MKIASILYLSVDDYDSLEPLLRSAETILSPADHARMLQFRLLRDRLNLLLSRMLLREFLAQHFGEQTFALSRSPEGRPIIDGLPVSLSVTHTGGLVAVAFSVDHPVGIDVETADGKADLNALLGSVATAEERAEVLQAEDPTHAFYRLWTVKEAYLKAKGVGIVADLDHLDVLQMTREGEIFLHEELLFGRFCLSLVLLEAQRLIQISQESSSATWVECHRYRVDPQSGHLSRFETRTAPSSGAGHQDDTKVAGLGSSPELDLGTPRPSTRPHRLRATDLGCHSFRRAHGTDYAYVSGAMVRGIASSDLVIRMARAGMLGILGTGGLPLTQIEESLRKIQRELPEGRGFGANLLDNLDDPTIVDKTVDLYLELGIRCIEAAAFSRMLPALVRFSLNGLRRGADGSLVRRNRILAKVSRPVVARAFMSPAPEAMVQDLLAAGRITEEEGALAHLVPISQDITVEADSAGHTDRGSHFSLLPAIIALRDEVMQNQGYAEKIRVGAAGGIGTPEAAAALLVLGADYLVTGSINQCTPEAATSQAVKELLQQMDVDDTAYAPAGDMFELGAQVQVLKKGLFFPSRATHLHDLYRRFGSLAEIDASTRKQLENRYFRRSLDEVYGDVLAFLDESRPGEIERVERDPKHKMAMIFKWYFHHSTNWALEGNLDRKLDYQILCGPALGAYNRHVRGTDLEAWEHRHVDRIAIALLDDTADLLNRRSSDPTSTTHQGRP